MFIGTFEGAVSASMFVLVHLHKKGSNRRIGRIEINEAYFHICWWWTGTNSQSSTPKDINNNNIDFKLSFACSGQGGGSSENKVSLMTTRVDDAGFSHLPITWFVS